MVGDMRDLLDAAAHLFLGSTCPGCHRPSMALCPGCAGTLAADEPHEVLRDGIAVPVAAAHDYRPLVERLVPAFKDDGSLMLAGILGRRLAAAVRHLDPPADACLVPVPSLPAAVRRRGLDHGRRLAAEAARCLGLRPRHLLRRRRAGADQRGLGRAGRRQNLAGSMSVGAVPVGTVAVVCDDVITTGSSVAESVNVLEAAGVEVWGVALIGDADRNRRAGMDPVGDG